MKFDVTLVGGGPGGYVAAIRAAQLGMKVAVVEKEALGGVCLNWGCIPTKTLLKSAELYLEIQEKSAQFGIQVGEVEIDFPQIIQNSREVAEKLSKGIGYLMKKNKIHSITGRGKLTGPHSLEVEKEDGGKEVIQSEHFILATGARPRVIPGLEIDGEKIMTSRQILARRSRPESLVVVGAGAIGVEFAYFFNALGTKVTIVEMLERIVPQEDEDSSQALAKSFEKQGMEIFTASKIEDVEEEGDSLKVTMDCQGEKKSLEAEAVLLAIGVQGNIEDIGLEEVGIETERKHIKVNDYYQTKVSNIYAIGDVIGPPWLAHVASREGILAVEHLAGKEVEPLDYTTVPGCTYCQPQVASVGYTEGEAREKGYDIKVGKFPLSASGKAQCLGETEGFVKVIFDAKYGELLGCHMVGSEATELVAEFTLGRVSEATYLEVLQTIHPHPTLSESILEATHAALGEEIHI